MSSTIDWSKAPEGAMQAHAKTDTVDWYYCDTSRIYKWDEKLSSWFKLSDREVILLRSSLAYIQQRPTEPQEPTPWNGECLPPVGTVCEFFKGEPDGSDWHPELPDVATVEIIAHFYAHTCKIAAFTFRHDRDCIQVEQARAECFRPLKTAEQIAAEERSAAIDEMVTVWRRTMGRFAVEDRGLAEMLYDAGYRKVEQP